MPSWQVDRRPAFSSSELIYNPPRVFGPPPLVVARQRDLRHAGAGAGPDPVGLAAGARVRVPEQHAYVSALVAARRGAAAALAFAEGGDRSLAGGHRDLQRGIDRRGVVLANNRFDLTRVPDAVMLAATGTATSSCATTR